MMAQRVLDFMYGNPRRQYKQVMEELRCHFAILRFIDALKRELELELELEVWVEGEGVHTAI